MNGIRFWLPSAVLVVGCSVSFAQTPGEEPAIAAALPGGTVVGSNRVPGVTVGINEEPAAPAKTPAVAAPIAPTKPVVESAPPPPVLPSLPADTPVNGIMSHSFVPVGNSTQGNNCCGPVGGNGRSERKFMHASA